MQPLNGTASFFQHKYNRDFTIFDSTPYTVAQCKAALHTHRVEVFRYELHRLNPGVGWFFVSDITQKVKKCTLHYDGLGIEFMGSATFEIVDTNNEINWLTDKIRVFHMLQMPDTHYVVWEKGTYYVPSPKQALKAGASRVVETQDTLRVYMEDKITDWLKIPSAPVPPDTYDQGDPINWARHFVGYGYPGTGIDISPDTTIRVGDDPPPAPQRNRSKIFQVGTPKLDVINSLLLYCNYEILRADVDGSLISHPFVKPSLRPVEYTLIADGTSIIVRESGETEQDLWDAPNQWLRTVTRPDAPLLRSRLTLTDPLNPLSTTYRGRVVTDEASIDAPDQATLDTVVQALFEDGQRIIKTLRVKTPLMPWSHHDKVMVQWTTNHPWAGVSNGIYTIYKWDFPCIPGGQMDLTLQIVPFSPSVPTPLGGTTSISGGYGYYVNGVFIAIPVGVQVSDAGFGTEFGSPLLHKAAADSGVGTEAQISTNWVIVADSGVGTESNPAMQTGTTFQTNAFQASAFQL